MYTNQFYPNLQGQYLFIREKSRCLNSNNKNQSHFLKRIYCTYNETKIVYGCRSFFRRLVICIFNVTQLTGVVLQLDGVAPYPVTGRTSTSRVGLQDVFNESFVCETKTFQKILVFKKLDKGLMVNQHSKTCITSCMPTILRLNSIL